MRFVLEAAFLIALAVAAGLAELKPTTIVLVMAAAWLLVAVIEWLAWREGPRITRIVREDAAPAPVAEVVPVAGDVETGVEPKARRRRFWSRRTAEEVVPEPAPAPPAEQAPAVAAVRPGEDTQDLGPPEEQPAPVPADERAGT